MTSFLTDRLWYGRHRGADVNCVVRSQWFVAISAIADYHLDATFLEQVRQPFVFVDVCNRDFHQFVDVVDADCQTRIAKLQIVKYLAFRPTRFGHRL